MKKIIIILAVVLTSTLTALSITRGENKTVENKATVEKAALSKTTGVTDLATAD